MDCLAMEPLSGAGRKSSTHVKTLMRQLGLNDDGSEIVVQSPKKPTKPDDGSAAYDGGQMAGLDKLRAALKEVMGENEEPDTAAAIHGDAHGSQGAELSPAQIRAKRERERPSASFKTPTRNKMKSLDVGVRFRAPPVGTYRPKSGQGRPRITGFHDFGCLVPRPPEKVYGSELRDYGNGTGIAEHPPNHMASHDFGKQTNRKAEKLQCNVNSFTAGVLEGDLSCSNNKRAPEWDFANCASPEVKLREYYFQPGQYKLDMDQVRPRDTKPAAFSKQTDRRPFLGGVPTGHHLPDRSLSRSCPHLSNTRSYPVPDISKYTVRPAFFKPADDNKLDGMKLNPVEAARATMWRKPSIESFDKSVDRGTHIKGSRNYGQDVAMTREREWKQSGPSSADLYPGIQADTALNRKRVNVNDFELMAGRGSPGIDVTHVPSPSARARDHTSSLKFERSSRLGETRAEAGDLSPLAGGISERRKLRGFEALP